MSGGECRLSSCRGRGRRSVCPGHIPSLWTQGTINKQYKTQKHLHYCQQTLISLNNELDFPPLSCLSPPTSQDAGNMVTTSLPEVHKGQGVVF